MFFAIAFNGLSLSFMSLLAIVACCAAAGFMAMNKPTRHPVAVADVLGRSGRVHLGILAAGVLGVLIALIAEHGMQAESASEDSDSD